MILPNQNDDFNLFTQKWVGTNTNNEEIQLINIFQKNKTFFKNKNLFPNKLKNMKKRDMRVSSIIYKPYVIGNYVVNQKRKI